MNVLKKTDFASRPFDLYYAEIHIGPYPRWYIKPIDLKKFNSKLLPYLQTANAQYGKQYVHTLPYISYKLFFDTGSKVYCH